MPIRRRKKGQDNSTENDFLGNLVISTSPFLANNKPQPYGHMTIYACLSYPFFPTSSLSLSVMDVSQTDENTKNHQITLCLPQSIQEKLSGLKLGEELIKPAQPHEALFLVLPCLNLLELLTLSRVCILLKDAIDNDILVWLDIIVESPLNMRINDDILLKFTSKALGRLRSLVLMNCVRITDDGLHKVIENNPHIEKLYIPSCTQLTPDGIVRVVKSLTDQSNKLKFLRLENVQNLTKEHLQILQSCLKISPEEQKPKVYLAYELFPSLSDTNAIDVEVCPKCKNVKLVFECPRETCRNKNKRLLQACKGCLHCIPRCEGCGGCVDVDETGETACLDVVCLDCWLKLPKCNLCNKPYCNRHADNIQWSQPYSSGFVCDSCTGEMEQWLASPC
ncbi:F-box protein skip28 [Thalictrum thalictroides]|uniref:F-box protein skip28 n=1 Tax=Thalictrum thalictroides TaxID=46969 RepID=A0A7J6VKH4_THATH|nr:F-box protein skip28 [Thalictrum thalictroides]